MNSYTIALTLVGNIIVTRTVQRPKAEPAGEVARDTKAAAYAKYGKLLTQVTVTKNHE